MRKYLILILLLIPSLCLGNDAALIMGKAPSAISTILGKAKAGVSSFAGSGVSAAACTVDNDSQLWHPTTQPGISDSGAAWVATKFTLAAANTITLYKIKESDSGSDTGNERIVIMNHDSENDYPDETSEIANSTVSTAMSSVPASPTVISHILSSTIVLPAGTYWLVNQEENSADRYVRYVASTGDRACYSANSGLTWSCTANTTYDMELWGCE